VPGNEINYQKAPQFPDLDGCFSFRSAFASICRMRSLVYRELLADFFQVWSVFMPMPKACARRVLRGGQRGQHAGGGLAKIALDRRVDGRIRLVLVKSPRWESSSSPTGFPATAALWHLENFSNLLHGMRVSRPTPRASVPPIVQHLARVRTSVDGLDHVHGNADGARLIGDARVIACRIHQVA